jgi:hypothetical protein
MKRRKRLGKKRRRSDQKRSERSAKSKSVERLRKVGAYLSRSPGRLMTAARHLLLALARLGQWTGQLSTLSAYTVGAASSEKLLY